MKKLLVVLMALAMVVSMLAAFPFAASADESEGEAATVWSGKANIKWYLNALEANPEADEFHLASAEDLAGLAYLVNAYYDKDTLKTCYKGVWYDQETGDVLGFALSGSETGYAFNFAELGFYIPAEGEKFDATTGLYTPDYDEDYENTVDGSAVVNGFDFEYSTVILDADVVLNTGNASDWASEKPQNVWMPIGGGRSSSATFATFNGTFKGNGHTISGAYFSSNATDTFGVALFGYVAKGRAVTIQDLVLENSYFRGGDATGSVVGRTNNMTTLTNCHVKNTTVEALSSSAGGFAGAVHGGAIMIEQCSATGMLIQSPKAVGGMIGGLNFQEAYITDCLVEGTVHGYTTSDGETTRGGWDVGGLVGRVAQGAISVTSTIADVALIQDANDYGEENSSYTAQAGIVYGAVGINGGNKQPFPAPTLTIDNFYYVDKIQSASGHVLAFTLATKIGENSLLGKAPKQTVFGFDFETVWDYGSTNTEDSIADRLPKLRNAGKATDEEDSGSGEVDPPVTETHIMGDWIKEQKATCTTAGTKGHYHCTHCNKDFDRAGNEITDLVIPATGHNYGEWIEEKAATSSEEGAKAHYTCSGCGKYFDKDHNEIADIVIPKTAKGGCGGVIVGVPLVAVVVFGAAMLVRKKENENK